VRERISVSLPEGLRAELDRLTEADGTSRSGVVREALREYLFARQLRTLRQELMPYAEDQGIYTDEDVFRAVARRHSICR
jgi:metal-responsive CopG/Arc/MetJ family transcriptional regulator